jgi:hypothetical protein
MKLHQYFEFGHASQDPFSFCKYSSLLIQCVVMMMVVLVLVVVVLVLVAVVVTHMIWLLTSVFSLFLRDLPI